MLRYSLCALAGAWSLQLAGRLPSDGLLPATAAIAALLLARPTLRAAGCVVAGACLAWLAADRVLDDRLPRALEGEAVPVVGRVADFPDARSDPVRFVLAPEGAPSLPGRIRVSWYGAPQVPRIGETWAFELKLRRPRGFANPLHFDYEHWLFRQGIGATGYVLGGRRMSGAAGDGVAALRDRLAARMLDLLGHDSASAVLLAVTVGATHEITREEWERYALTGTSHLMAISGMNIAMAAGGAGLLAWIVAAPFCRRTNARDVAACVAAVAAVAYAEISGFAIPVRRAMLMALLVLGAALLRREQNGARVLAITCLAIVVTDPLAVHAPGFKLSFAAVAILLWYARQQRLRAAHSGPAWRRWRSSGHAAVELCTLQLALLLGLFPLTALLFGRVAWAAPLVNLVVVPLFNLVTVPAALLGLLLDGPFAPLGDALLRLGWLSVRLMLLVVEAAATWPRAHTTVALLPPALLPVAFLPAVWAAAPPGFPGRRLAWLAAAAVVLYRPPAAPPGCVDVTALDVGQGLAMVARTARHTLVYDTGPSFRSGSDTGTLVVVPYLRAHGVDRVDRLVVSHGDSDHAGGVAALLDALPVGEVFAGERLAIGHPQQACRAGQRWQWDGVRFAILHPGTGPAHGNDASCVLEIAAGDHRVLLTGDIEAAAERRLLESGRLRPAGLVAVPHHGSATSSSAAFVERLRAREAIVSAGYGNRWNLPRSDVVSRWTAAGTRVLDTATAGAVAYRVCPDAGVVLAARHRVDERRYWHE